MMDPDLVVISERPGLHALRTKDGETAWRCSSSRAVWVEEKEGALYASDTPWFARLRLD
jgi:hypothetical protein